MIDYMNPDVPAGLNAHDVTLVKATADSLEGFGMLVDDPNDVDIEIVQWPQQGWRAIDDGTGDEGGTVEGDFLFWWQDGTLFGRNKAVNDQYVLGWDHDPSTPPGNGDSERRHLYLWHANYHPDGGQMFFPKEKRPFVTVLALPGDDVQPSDFVAFYCDGSKGLYIHPGIWHEAIMPLDEELSFLDRQGKVHARVSCFFTREFNAYLRVPLEIPA